MISRIVLTLAMALCLLGCDVMRMQVPLITDETQEGGGCWLLHQVVDVVADPSFGTAIKGDGGPLRWPKGYTAWRTGLEVEVLDPAGKVVLTTGGRYWLCPTPQSDISKPISEWVIGDVRPCPDCELGGGID